MPAILSRTFRGDGANVSGGTLIYEVFRSVGHTIGTEYHDYAKELIEFGSTSDNTIAKVEPWGRRLLRDLGYQQIDSPSWAANKLLPAIHHPAPTRYPTPTRHRRYPVCSLLAPIPLSRPQIRTGFAPCLAGWSGQLVGRVAARWRRRVGLNSGGRSASRTHTAQSVSGPLRCVSGSPSSGSLEAGLQTVASFGGGSKIYGAVLS